MIGFVLAVPSLPHIFSGVTEYSGNPGMILTGYEITASINGYGLGIVGEVQTDNSYSIAIDSQGKTGEITFYIGGAEAEETGIWEWGGENFYFDLTINELPVNALCGNNIQEPGEQCDMIDLGTGTCENVLGILGATGTLSCTSICTFDYSNCTVEIPQDPVSPPPSSGGGGSSNSPSSPSGTVALEIQEQEIEIEDKEIEILNGGTKKQDERVGTGLGAVTGFLKTGPGIGLVFVLIILVLGTVVFIVQKRKVTK